MLFGKKRIYADAAATTPLSKAAYTELLRLLPLYGNPGSLHKEGIHAKEELKRAREVIAQAVGAHPDEVIFTASGTEANNLAVVGILHPLMCTSQTHALTSAIEHPSVLEPLRELTQEGLKVTEFLVDEEGLLNPHALFEAITDETALVSVQLINSEIGTIQPIRDIAKQIRRVRKDRLERSVSRPIYFHCDASQAPLWMVLRIDTLGIDLMTLDAHKLQGPKGIGALIVRRGTALHPIIFGGSQEGSLRAATENVLLAGAFAVALQGAQQQAENTTKRIGGIRDKLMREIERTVPGVQIHGPLLSHRVPNNINLSIGGLDGEVAVIAMDKEGISISTRSTCSLEEKEQSHVLRAIGVSPDRINSALRITLLPTATPQDSRAIVRALQTVARRYKNIA